MADPEGHEFCLRSTTDMRPLLPLGVLGGRWRFFESARATGADRRQSVSSSSGAA